MTITLIFLSGLMGVVVWWLVKQTNVKPWLTETAFIEDIDAHLLNRPKAKTGLWVFLAVATSVFCLFISAYSMRMTLSDWTPLPEPDLLWLNTGLLILASVTLQWAMLGARQGRMDSVKTGMHLAGFFTLAFMVGQLFAWQELNELGYYLASNPANSFFYLLTALHGIHLLGGLAVWARATVRIWRGFEVEQIRLSVELCAMYWHFLLIVWLVLFGLMLST